MSVRQPVELAKSCLLLMTREPVEASGESVLDIPSRALARSVLAVGSRSGRDGDKFEAFEA